MGELNELECGLPRRGGEEEERRGGEEEEEKGQN